MKYFDDIELIEAKKFREYFIQNFLARADITIQNILDTDLQSFTLRELRKVVKSSYLDPSNLIFIARQLFSHQNYIQDKQRAQMAKVMFDLHLGFAIVYKSEEDFLISLDLLKGSSWSLDLMKTYRQAFLSNTD